MALTLGHKLDQNTLALYRLDEASGTVTADLTGRYPLSGPALTAAAPLIQDGGRSRTFPGVLSVAMDAAAKAVAAAEFTVETWVQPASNWSAQGRICSFYKQTFAIEALAFGLSAARLPFFGWTIAGVFGGIATGPAVPAGVRTHMAARKKISGGNFQLDLFINGFNVATATRANTDAVPVTLYVGGYGDGEDFNGQQDDIRISSVARTDQEIADSFWRGLIDISQIKPVPFQQGASTAWQSWYQQIDPTELQQPNGAAFQMALAAVKDHLAERRRLAVKAKLPGIAPTDALAQLAIERGIFPGPTETDTAFAQRLVSAWNAWPWAGTPFGTLSQLSALGYPNVVVETARGLQYSLDNGGTNLLTFSQSFTQGNWSITGAAAIGGTGSAPILTPNAGAAPDGTTTATRLQLNKGAGNTASDFSRLLNTSVPFAVAPQANDFSIWLKSNTGATQNVAIEVQSGTLLAVQVTTAWQRFSLVMSSVSVTPSQGAFVSLRGASGTDNTCDILIWGAQVELSSLPGPYTITYNTNKPAALPAGSLLVSTLPSGSWWIDSNRAPPGVTAWAASTVYAAGVSVVPSAVPWTPSTSFPAGTCVAPTVAAAQTGLYYRSSGGTSGTSQPAWPTTPGGTVTDNGITWTAFRRDFVFKTPAAGTSGTVQPTWPTAYGATIGDGSINWANDGNDNWSRFEVIFPLPLPASWAGTPPAYSSDEVTRIRKVIRDWSPTIAVPNRIVVVQQGGVWGYSDGTWGDGGTWGGSTTVWSPV